MKLKFLVILLVCLMSSGTFAATIGAWNAPADTNGVVGSWSNPLMWVADVVPVPTTVTGDEIKIQSPGSTVTIDDTASINYIQRLTLGSTDSTRPIVVNITEPDPEFTTTFGMYEFRVSSPSGATANAYSQVNQTGGTLNVDDLMITRCKSNTTVTVQGEYKISGGTIQTRGSKNRILVAAYAETMGPAGTGTFIVDGDGGTINAGSLFVGSNVSSSTAGAGTGTLQFNLVGGVVSEITVATQVSLDQTTGSTTKLVVNGSTAAPVVLLVETIGANPVVGLFDTINGIAAPEGAIVSLAGSYYVLTYIYDAATATPGAGNDIALLIPEPATVALLSIGLLAIRRRK